MSRAPFQTFGVPESPVLFLVLLCSLAVMVGIPTLGMYDEASERTDSPYVWTGRMLVCAVVVPGIGPVLLWVVYTVVEG